MNPSVQHDDQQFLSLLEKWQRGDFTRADERVLNALAATDDFRREAMEGFMSLPEAEHEARLQALRARLRERAGRSVGGRRFALPEILAAAATVALLLTAIWFFPTLNKDDTAPIAQQQEESTALPRPSESAPSSEAPDDEQIAMQQRTAKPAPSPSGGSSAPLSDRAFSGPSGEESAPDFAAADEKAAEMDDKQTNMVVAPQTSPATPGRSTSAGEGITLDNAAPTESSKDKMATQPARDAAAKPATNAKKRAQNADSIWHDTDRKPDMDAERKKAREEAQAQQSEPVDGWEAFREYLRQNARLTPEARNRNVSGTVQLQFNVNANGEPTGFVVLRSLGFGCDQEAIRLVQNWEWVHGKNPIVTVDVPFVR